MRYVTKMLWISSGGMMGILPSIFFSKVFVPSLLKTGEYRSISFWITLSIFIPTGMLIGNKLLNKLRNSLL